MAWSVNFTGETGGMHRMEEKIGGYMIESP
jgi:hypothetical protein